IRGGKIKPQKTRDSASENESLMRSPASSADAIQLNYRKNRLCEALDRRRFVLMNLEHRNQFGDRQQVADALGRIQKFQFAARALNGRIATDDFTEAAAVHVGHVGKVQ